MASSSDLDEGIMKTVELRMLELSVVEAEEIVHDDITSQRWKGMTKIQRLLPGLKLLHANGEGVDVAVDDVYKVKDRAAREPVRG